jgi:hypothetical protein
VRYFCSPSVLGEMEPRGAALDDGDAAGEGGVATALVRVGALAIEPTGAPGATRARAQGSRSAPFRLPVAAW